MSLSLWTNMNWWKIWKNLSFLSWGKKQFSERSFQRKSMALTCHLPPKNLLQTKSLRPSWKDIWFVGKLSGLLATLTLITNRRMRDLNTSTNSLQANSRRVRVFYLTRGLIYQETRVRSWLTLLCQSHQKSLISAPSKFRLKT